MASAAEEARKAAAAYAKFQAAADLAETSSRRMEQAAQRMEERAEWFDQAVVQAATRIGAKAEQAEGRIETMAWKIEQSGQRLDRAIQNAEGRQSFWYFLLWAIIAGCSGAYLPGVLQWFVSLFR